MTTWDQWAQGMMQSNGITSPTPYNPYGNGNSTTGGLDPAPVNPYNMQKNPVQPLTPTPGGGSAGGLGTELLQAATNPYSTPIGGSGFNGTPSYGNGFYNFGNNSNNGNLPTGPTAVADQYGRTTNPSQALPPVRWSNPFMQAAYQQK